MRRWHIVPLVVIVCGMPVSSLLQVLPVAFIAACYPALLAAVVVLLRRPRRRLLLSVFIGGGLTASIGFGLVSVLALRALLRHPRGSQLSSSMDLVVGCLVLLLAVALGHRADTRLARRRKRNFTDLSDRSAEQRKPLAHRILERGEIPVVLLVALVLNLPGPAYLLGLKDIAGAQADTSATIGLVIGFNLIMFLLGEVPLLGLIIDPGRTEGVVLTFNSWLNTHGRRIVIGLCLILGAFLIARGIARA